MKKRVGSYKGKPIVEGGGENTLTKNEISSKNINSNSVSKYSPSYYKVIDTIDAVYIILLGLCSVLKYKTEDNRISINTGVTLQGYSDFKYKNIKQVCVVPIYDTTTGFCYNIEEYIDILNNLGQNELGSILQSSIIRISEEEFYDITNI